MITVSSERKLSGDNIQNVIINPMITMVIAVILFQKKNVYRDIRTIMTKRVLHWLHAKRKDIKNTFQMYVISHQ